LVLTTTSLAWMVPFTESLYVGFVVPMPTLPEGSLSKL